MRRLKNWKIVYGDTLIQKILNSYSLKSAQDLYYLIATEKLELLDIKEKILKEESIETNPAEAVSVNKEIKEQVEWRGLITGCLNAVTLFLVIMFLVLLLFLKVLKSIEQVVLMPTI
jgi:hypothetical protein